MNLDMNCVILYIGILDGTLSRCSPAERAELAKWAREQFECIIQGERVAKYIETYEAIRSPHTKFP